MQAGTPNHQLIPSNLPFAGNIESALKFTFSHVKEFAALFLFACGVVLWSSGAKSDVGKQKKTEEEADIFDLVETFAEEGLGERTSEIVVELITGSTEKKRTPTKATSDTRGDIPTTLVTNDKEVMTLREKLMENELTLKTTSGQLDRRTQDVANLQNEIKEMERRLQKIDELRCNAENERDLMSGHLQRYQQVELKYQQEKEETASQLRQAKHEIQILKSSNSDPASIQKAQVAINEMKKEQEEAKKEAQRLRETNKLLLQRNVAEQKYRDRLHRQIADLKNQLAEKGFAVPEDDVDMEEPKETDKIWGYQPPSPTYRLRQHQEGDNSHISNVLDTESEASSVGELGEFVQTKVVPTNATVTMTTLQSSSIPATQTVSSTRSYAMHVSSLVRGNNKNLNSSNNSNDSYEDINDRDAFVSKNW